MIRVLSIDPAFRNTGWCVFELDRHSEKIIDVGVVRTKKGPKRCRVGADNHRCACIIAAGLLDLAKKWRPVLLLAEAQSGSKNNKAAQLQGMGWGILSAVSVAMAVPVYQVLPSKVKLVTGNRKATKPEVAAAVTQIYPELLQLVDGVRPVGVHEHIYDAAAVFAASKESKEVEMIRQVANQQIPKCAKCQKVLTRCKCAENELTK